MNSLGRNDTCHCGSGRKYKKCCLEKDEAEARAAQLAEASARDKTAEEATEDETGESFPDNKKAKGDSGPPIQGKTAFSAKVERSLQTGGTPGWSRSSTGNR